MNNKGIGAVFCLISAILISAKYLSAAIFMSGGNTWDATLFAAGLSYVGPVLSIASVRCTDRRNFVSRIWGI